MGGVGSLERPAAHQPSAQSRQICAERFAASEGQLINSRYSKPLRLIELQRSILGAAVPRILLPRLVPEQCASDSHHLRISVSAQNGNAVRKSFVQLHIQSMIVRVVERTHHADVSDIRIRPPVE